MKAYLIVPEQLELRFEATNALAVAGYGLLSHYRSVRVCHDLNGIEIDGILEKKTAHEIAAILSGIFPFWRSQVVILETSRTTELNWLVCLACDCSWKGGVR